MKLVFKLPLSIAVSAAAFMGVSMAQDWYVSGQVQWQQQMDSSNSGNLTQDFTTGQGTTIPAGTVLAAGTPLAWETEFDNGFGVSAEVGRKFRHGLRGSLEVAYEKADVDSHQNVAVGGAPVGTEDAALLTGSAAPLGADVAAVVANGQGNVENTSVFANVYYDFHTGTRVKPYVGAGLGVSQVEVKFNPSDVQIAKDDSTELAYQVKAGATYQVNPRMDLFAEATYRATQDVKVELDLVPGNLKVSNERALVGIGLRYRFGH